MHPSKDGNLIYFIDDLTYQGRKMDYRDIETICFLYIYFKIFKMRFLIQTTYTNKLDFLKWGEKM